MAGDNNSTHGTGSGGPDAEDVPNAPDTNEKSTVPTFGAPPSPGG